MRDTFSRSMRGRVSGTGLIAKMTRGALFAAALAGTLVSLSPSAAHADADRVKFLADKLNSDDPRVRTSAALALGASNEDGAVDPLCGALEGLGGGRPPGLGRRDEAPRPCERAFRACSRASRARATTA